MVGGFLNFFKNPRVTLPVRFKVWGRWDMLGLKMNDKGTKISREEREVGEGWRRKAKG